MLSSLLLRIAIVYFAIGVSLGLYMGVTHDFRFVHVHVHLNLLGWVSLALIGLTYRGYPMLESSWIAHAHFWLHNLGLPVFMGGYSFNVLTGERQVAPLAVGSVSIALGVGLLMARFLRVLRAQPPGTPG